MDEEKYTLAQIVDYLSNRFSKHAPHSYIVKEIQKEGTAGIKGWLKEKRRKIIN